MKATSRVHVVGYLSIDRIDGIAAQGRAVPGGAALYVALAARAAGAETALHAVAGADFPRVWLDRLGARGIDLAGVAKDEGPTRRARLVYAGGDSRRSDHHAEAQWWARTRALAPSPPEKLASGDVVALAPVPAAIARSVVARATARGARVAMDTSAAFALAEASELLELIARVHVFAPSLEETRLLLPAEDDDATARLLAGRGCHVLQKRGRQGAFAVLAGGGAEIHIGAPAAEAIDATGAGDATLGGLAAALAAGRDFFAAAQAALASGALCVGGLGPAALGLEFGPTDAT